MVFHALSFDPDFEDSWSLDVQHLHDDGSWKDVWAFTRCERIANIPFEIIVEEHGRAPDFDVTGAFAVPVVSEKVADILQRICPNDIQLLAFSIPKYGNRFVLNVLNRIDAIDHDLSLIQYWPDDPNALGFDQSKAGKPRGVMRLAISETRVNHHQLFRLAGWEIAIIASHEIVTEFIREGVTGFAYNPVSG